jgi:hypothetical protein
LGGSQSDTIRAIATDAAQNIYVVGEASVLGKSDPVVLC